MKPNITAYLVILSATILLTLYFIQKNMYQLYSSVILLIYIVLSFIHSYRFKKIDIFTVRTRSKLTGLLGERVETEIFIENKINKTYILEIIGFNINRGEVKIGYKPTRFLMKPKSSKIVKIYFTPIHQGEYLINSVTLKIVTENTLYYFVKKVKLNIVVSVYPKTYMLVAYIRGGGGGRVGGSPLNRFVRRGFEYIGSRKYYPGDEDKIIDWKATARLQKLMVKQFQDEGKGSIAVFLDITNTSEIILDNLAQIAVLVINSAYRRKIPIIFALWVRDKVKKIIGPTRDRRNIDLIYGEILKLFQRIELVKSLNLNLIDTELTPIEKYMFKQIGEIYSILEKIRRERILDIVRNRIPKNVKIIFITDLSSTIEDMALNRNISIVIPHQFWKNIENPKARQIAWEYYYRKKIYLKKRGVKIVEIVPQKIWKGVLKCI